MKDHSNDNELLRKIRKGDLSAFESLFSDYYVMLGIIAKSFVKDTRIAEEIVADLFVKLWERRKYFIVTVSLKAYLIKSVQNRCINYLRQHQKENKQKQALEENINYEVLRWSDDFPLDKILEEELSDRIEKAIRNLPPRCREIFILSRDKGLQYDEIAVQLKISVNTVKGQMKIALARLRKDLGEWR